MSDLKNTQIVLAKTPEGTPVPSDFTTRSVEVTPPEAGEVLVKNLYLSLDPYMRSQIAGRHLSGAITPGDLMKGETIAEVVQSEDPAFSAGDIVRGFGGWQEYAVMDGKTLTAVHAPVDNNAAYLSALGTTGLTAWAGIVCTAKPAPGDVVVIPAATGGVGATAAQLAKLYGCKVVGIAGGKEKCDKAVKEIGYDICLDRKAGDIAEQLKAACPDGINVYFDLVGGELLNTVSSQLAVGARVVLCGIMSELNSTSRAGGPHPAIWIKSRAQVTGLVVYDYEPRRAEFVEYCLPHYLDGKLKTFEDVSQGIASAPDAFCRLMRGENTGKVIIKI
ncbi:NADP-dependent oxidoreductase [Alteromonas sp. NFXS44]|uniref:NADP-dependent oxidoreductase n=1 Tax=Alteromonas sp. NFXS44 TaxID=2818435 RepID=UPI0032DFAA1B